MWFRCAGAADGRWCCCRCICIWRCETNFIRLQKFLLLLGKCEVVVQLFGQKVNFRNGNDQGTENAQ